MADTTDELKPLLEQLLVLVRENSAQLADLRQRMDRMEARMDRLEARVEAGFQNNDMRLQVIDARLDEQRSVLCAMIPTRIAAVGSSKTAAE